MVYHYLNCICLGLGSVSMGYNNTVFNRVNVNGYIYKRVSAEYWKRSDIAKTKPDRATNRGDRLLTKQQFIQMI